MREAPVNIPVWKNDFLVILRNPRQMRVVVQNATFPRPMNVPKLHITGYMKTAIWPASLLKSTVHWKLYSFYGEMVKEARLKKVKQWGDF